MPPKKTAVSTARTSDIGYVPFADVIADPQLMQPLWNDLSLPQQVALKAFYGLPLLSPAEQRAWAILQGSCHVDALGYPVEVTPIPYTPKEYDVLVGILGRRSGKSSHITAFATLYEVLFGGHMAHVMPGQDVVVPYIAQDLATAKANMIAIALMAQQVPLLAKQLVSATRDKIELKNGLTILPEPPAIKTGRGFAMPVVIGDEVGFWYRTAEAANPDYEVQRAVSYAQLQFPRAKQILISTPYTEEGLLWDYHRAGTGGHKLSPEDRAEYADTLVLQASTACMENPRVTRRRLEKLQRDDAEAFVRESLAQFVSSLSGFLPADLVHGACEGHGAERTRAQNEADGWKPTYVAAMDPAFRHDTFAFTICHMDAEGRVVQDVLRTWTPDSKLKQRLDPASIMSQIGALTQAWGVSMVYSDQYQLEALQQLALQYHFTIIGRDFTGQSKAKMYGSLLHLLRTHKLHLLDVPVILTQLTQLQKKLNPMGHVQIAAPPGKHDDVASVIALATSVAVMQAPARIVERKAPSLFDEGLACIKRRRLEAEVAWN